MNVLKNEDVRSTKWRTCSLCGEQIPACVVHRMLVSKDGGGFSRHRYHKECDAVTEIDKWDDIDWETFCDELEFRKRREELRESGKLLEYLQTKED